MRGVYTKVCFPIFLIFVILFVNPLSAWGRARRYSLFSVVINSTSYSDVQTQSGQAETTLTSSYEGELGIRMHSLFSFLLTANKESDDLRQGFGLGMRVNLPGFFLLGASRKDSTRWARNYPVNTSFYVKAEKMTVKDEEGPEVNTLATQYGLSMDIFLFNPLIFISGHASLFTLQGNVFFASGGGVGFEF